MDGWGGRSLRPYMPLLCREATSCARELQAILSKNPILLEIKKSEGRVGGGPARRCVRRMSWLAPGRDDQW